MIGADESSRDDVAVGKVYGEYKVTAADDIYVTYTVNPVSRWSRILTLALFAYAALVLNSMLWMSIALLLLFAQAAIFYLPARKVRSDIKFAQANNTAIVNGSPMSFSNPATIKIFRNGGKRS